MKKIVLIGPAYPYRGGQALVEAYLYHELSRTGYEVNTITFTLMYPPILFPGKTQYDQSQVIPYAHPEKIQRMINSIWPLSWWRTIRAVRRMKPDLVIFVWWMPFFAPAYWTIASGLKGHTRIAFLIENYISHEERWFDGWASQFCLRSAEAFICESGYVESELTRDFPDTPCYRTTLSIYDCYDLKRYTRQQAREKLGVQSRRMILFFGLIRPYKGLANLIEAFRQVAREDSDVELWIVGECYEDEAKYRRLIAEHPAGEHIHFRNQFVPNEELEMYFKACDVVCLPYESATQSGILMIAYAFGVPVVATRVGGLPELVVPDRTGKLVEPGHPGALARALLDLLEEDRAKYEANIRNLAATLGYQNIPQIVADILKDQHPEQASEGSS